MERLTPEVQRYAWGDSSFLASLQGRVPSGEPEAELWMGAHPNAPATLADGRKLNSAIAENPELWLGPSASARFGELPFLFKILTADRALSIQAHPDADQAARGFDREQAAGIPINGAVRTYRDRNHKPELICALTRFEAKCGFRPLDETRAMVDRLRDERGDALAQRLNQSGTDEEVLRDTTMWLLREADAATISSVVHAASSLEETPWRLVAAWTQELHRQYPNDPGVVVGLLLNHVVLEPGEALFLGAGVLHAYLRGAAMELMANSDNVIRGGLTPKHVDIDELAEVVVTAPEVISPQRPAHPVHRFDAPVDEFGLTRIVLADSTYDAVVSGPEIVVTTDGSATISMPDGASVEIHPGEPVFIAGTDLAWSASGHATVFRATVG